MNTQKGLLSFLPIITVLALFACTTEQELSISDAWARPGIAGGNSGVFFVIDNPTGQNDRLLSARSDIAQAVEIHKTTMSDDVMQMTPQDFVEIPAGEQVIFQPGDLHVMLIELHNPLNLGDSFELTLIFENAGEIALNITVQER